MKAFIVALISAFWQLFGSHGVRVALIQPVPRLRSKSLGIFKSPESIQALAGQLEAFGYNVRMYHSSTGWGMMIRLLLFNPNVVGVSTMTPNFLEGKRIAQLLKLWRPRLPIVLGGWHASGAIQAHLHGQESESLGEILNPNSPFDYVVAGEGEEIFPRLIASLLAGKEVEAEPGVSIFRNGEIQVGGSTPRITNLREIAEPSWSGLKIKRYRDKRSGALDLSVHFNRSCRFQCAFCSTPTVYGHGVRVTPALQAFAYLKSVVVTHRPQVITFTDEDFFAHMSWVEELVSLLETDNLAKQFGVSFDTFASINDIHRLRKAGKGYFLDRMRAVGFGSFTIGVESFNPNILLAYNKEMMILPTMSREERGTYTGLDNDQKKRALVTHYRKRTQEAINFASEHGLLVVGDYILGNLGESVEDVRAGFEIFKNLENLLLAYIPVFTPFPGTKIWGDAYSSGLLPRNPDGNIDWMRFNASAGALNLGYDIGALRNELEIEFYTSSRYRRDMLKNLESTPALRGLFVGRFSYLGRLFPGDVRVREMIQLLG